MLTALALAAQLRVAHGNHESSALEQLVEAARGVNARIPPALAAYAARVEGELSNVLRFATGREILWGGAEQYAWQASWSPARYELHLIGQRGNPLVRKMGIGDPTPWLIPHLYGERFPGALPTRNQSRFRLPIHPFAAGAGKLYEYSGGDTVAKVWTGKRQIRLVLIHVVPKPGVGEESVFVGDVYLDSDAHQIVRLVGRFVLRSAAGTLETRVDVENAEVDGQFWLPQRETFEIEAQSPLLIAPFISRFVATIEGYDVTHSSDSSRRAQPTQTIGTKALGDSVELFDGWQRPLTAPDPDAFNEFVDAFPLVGARLGTLPTFRRGVSRPANAIHYNRVEGLFTGAEITVVPGEIAPGLIMRAHLGYAWAERTARGSLRLEKYRERLMVALEGRRALVSTSDFSPSETFAMLSEVMPTGRPDYVDRSTITAGVTWLLSQSARTFVSLRAGAGRDHDATVRTRGLFGTDSVMIADRFAASGNYGIASIDVGVGRPTPLRTLANSVGASVHLEAATGELQWMRLASASQVRVARRRLVHTTRVDAGIVFSPSIPPQQLFELGGADRLSGYDYKEFVGDRAIVGTSAVEFPLPIMKHATRPLERRGIPPLAPAFAVSIQGGWTDLSSSHQTSIAQLTRGGILPTPAITQGVVGSGGIGLTLFSGALHAGIARPLEAAGSWRPAVGLSATF